MNMPKKINYYIIRKNSYFICDPMKSISSENCFDFTVEELSTNEELSKILNYDILNSSRGILRQINFYAFYICSFFESNSKKILNRNSKLRVVVNDEDIKRKLNLFKTNQIQNE